MSTTVLFFVSSFKDSWIYFSFSTSKEAAISSNKIISAFFKNALAIEILCLSPPDKFDPFSPIRVFYPIGSLFTNSSQLASLAAFKTSSSLADKSPSLILSITLPLNNITS